MRGGEWFTSKHVTGFYFFLKRRQQETGLLQQSGYYGVHSNSSSSRMQEQGKPVASIQPFIVPLLMGLNLFQRTLCKRRELKWVHAWCLHKVRTAPRADMMSF